MAYVKAANDKGTGTQHVLFARMSNEMFSDIDVHIVCKL